jgi:hypothetical protein
VQYCSTWASSTLIILFSEILNFSKRKKKTVKENTESDGIFGNISFVEMESLKLINYLTHVEVAKVLR